MRKRAGAGVRVTTVICLCFAFAAHAQTEAPNAVQKGVAVATHARGTFEVKLNPQPPDDKAEGSTLGRMSIEKQFHGDFEGTSTGQMLTAMTDVKGSAGYVAIERVTGTLRGREWQLCVAAQQHAFKGHAATIDHRRAGLGHRTVDWPDRQNDDYDCGWKAFVRLRVHAALDALVNCSRCAPRCGRSRLPGGVKPAMIVRLALLAARTRRPGLRVCSLRNPFEND